MGCIASAPRDPALIFLRRISVKPWNVLGVSVSNGRETKVGAEPDETMLVVSSASLSQLRSPSQPLGKLPDSVGAVNRFVGVGDDDSFPDDVLAKIQAEGQAMYHRYGYPKSKHVIHVAAIDFASTSSRAAQTRLGLRVRSLRRVAASGTLLCLSSGSVTDFEGDAIVNAANEGCIQGAGVDDAINVAGGKDLRDARMALPVVSGAQRRDGGPTEVRCPMGEVRITVGGGLKASWCIHAVGPNYNVETKHGASMDECDKLVTTTYRRAVEAAKEKGLSSIAFPLVSGGMFRGKQSLKRVLEMGLTGICDGAYPGLKEVHVVAFYPEEQEELSQACSLVLPPSTDEVMAEHSETEMSQAAAIDKLAVAYTSVLSQAAQVEKEAIRLSPISSGSHAAQLRHWQLTWPEITVTALSRAVRQMPPHLIAKLSPKVELCIEDSSQVAKYERALQEQCNVA